MTTQTHAHAWRPADTLANRLYLLRKDLGITQRAAALQTGVTFGEWQSMENGAEARGLNVKVGRIAAALGVDRDWLMWGGELGAGPSPARPPVQGDAPVTERNPARNRHPLALVA